MRPATGGCAGPKSDPGPTRLYLTNYRGGGIGDFGASLGRRLEAALGPLEIVETDPQGRGVLGQAWRSAWTEQDLIANLGLTGWGRSGPRNAMGFAAIGLHRRRGRRTVVLVHHTIEMFGASETGYKLTPLVRWGAHWAIRRVRRCDLVTFSPALGEGLRSAYGAASVWVTPLPGDPPRPMPTIARRARVVMAGYLAPYKGVTMFLDVAERKRIDADFLLVGKAHPILAGQARFGGELKGWADRAKALDVAMPGYLDDEALDEAMAGPTIGLLPYASASGASASFGLYAARGVPVVASDLPEFRYLRDEGAGIMLAGPSPESYLGALEGLLGSPEELKRLRALQVEFARRHDWTHFAEELRVRMSGEPADPALTGSRGGE